MAKQSIGDNVAYEVKGNVMTITIDLTKDLGPSKSGKTLGIATTRGNAKFAGPGGEQMAIGLNCYRPNPEKEGRKA